VYIQRRCQYPRVISSATVTASVAYSYDDAVELEIVYTMTLIVDRVSPYDNAIGSVRPSVRPFVSILKYLLNRLTFELEFCI